MLVAVKEATIKDEVFISGVQSIKETGSENLLSVLFGIRSRQIRQGLPTGDATSYLSGHLIGADVLSASTVMKEIIPDLIKVVLIGELIGL